MSAAIAALALLCAPLAQACAPADFRDGTGTRAVVEFNTVGAAVGWWCPGATRPRLYAVRWAGMTQPLHESLQGLRSPTEGQAAPLDTASSIAALANANVNTPIAELADVWQPLMPRLNASRPAADVWRVAKAPANANPPGTRPTFLVSVTGGVVRLGREDGARVAEGVVCDCSLARVVNAAGVTTHCSVQNLISKVAVCVRQ
jgi:hypothetical protein